MVSGLIHHQDDPVSGAEAEEGHPVRGDAIDGIGVGIGHDLAADNQFGIDQHRIPEQVDIPVDIGGVPVQFRITRKLGAVRRGIDDKYLGR